MNPVQQIESLLHFSGIDTLHLGDDSRVELVALNARRNKQLPVLFRELTNLAFDHAAYGGGQVLNNIVEFPRQAPPVAIAGDNTLIPQISQEVRHEQRMSLGPRMKHVQKT